MYVCVGVKIVKDHNTLLFYSTIKFKLFGTLFNITASIHKYIILRSHQKKRRRKIVKIPRYKEIYFDVHCMYRMSFTVNCFMFRIFIYLFSLLVFERCVLFRKSNVDHFESIQYDYEILKCINENAPMKTQ